MSGNMAYFLLAVVVLTASLAAAAAYYFRQSREVSGSSWQELLGRLSVVDHSSIAQIALDAIDESGQRRTDDQAKQLDPEQIWELIGGLKGLELLEQNSLVLVDIACYVQHRYPEALSAADELRRNAREIEWHVSRLKKANESGEIEGWFANYAQNAIATYYLMTRRVLALYEANKLPMIGDWQKAL
jgi:hypothetical protein